jgi:hypothetical protein
METLKDNKSSSPSTTTKCVLASAKVKALVSETSSKNKFVACWPKQKLVLPIKPTLCTLRPRREKKKKAPSQPVSNPGASNKS